MQIVHHPNWYRDFLEDMARRGPTHLRDASQHCPIDNTIHMIYDLHSYEAEDYGEDDYFGNGCFCRG